MSTLGHTASLTFQNLTELNSPLNYTRSTWLNGEERETKLEQQLEEIENSSILSFFSMINVFFFLQFSIRCIKRDGHGHNLFNPFCLITDAWQILRLKSKNRKLFSPSLHSIKEWHSHMVCCLLYGSLNKLQLFRENCYLQLVKCLIMNLKLKFSSNKLSPSELFKFLVNVSS